MKVAIVHYWLTGMRGGEKVLEALCDIYPDADIYTHVVNYNEISEKLSRHQIFTTFINKLPFAKKYYAYYLPLMPIALESLDLTDYDLIISSESGPAKGIIPGPDATHICYTHSPMRYIWDMFHQYWGRSAWFKLIPVSIMAHYLRQWDSNSALRTDYFIANSSFVANRIQKYYRRKADILFPPVNTDAFTPIDNPERGYYLWVGELNAYKRPMDAVEAFKLCDKKLIMVGCGDDYKKIKSVINNNITLLKRVEDNELISLYQNCRALIYPGIEDFGIIPIEAMACGRPVIAYNKGGITDTVIHKKTGYLYNNSGKYGLLKAINEFEEIEERFDSSVIREHTEQFSTARFHQNFSQFLDKQKIPH